MRGWDCRAAVREDLRPEIPGSGRPRHSGDFGLRPNWSSTDIHLFFLCWCQSQLLFFFFCSKVLHFALCSVPYPLFFHDAILLLSAHAFRTSSMPYKVYTKKIYGAKAFSSRALFLIQG